MHAHTHAVQSLPGGEGAGEGLFRLFGRERVGDGARIARSIERPIDDKCRARRLPLRGRFQFTVMKIFSFLGRLVAQHIIAKAHREKCSIYLN